MNRLLGTVQAVAALCVCAVAIVSAATLVTPDYSPFKKKLPQDQRVIHALDRLTYGPRPGDVAAVKQMGLRQWIDLQLHPERISESPVLEAKLAPLDSLALTAAEVVATYPPPQLIRALVLGRQNPPDNPLARAAIERIAARLKITKDDVMDAPLEPLKPLEELLAPEQIQTLRTGTAAQRSEVLGAIPKDQVEQVILAMPQPMRQQLIGTVGPVLRRRLQIANAPQQILPNDLVEAKLYRAIYSRRQLQEEMVDFWYNHFNVFLDKDADRFLVASYERDAIRPHVFGKFRELLEATASSPAMLFYLDNWQSVAPDVAPGQFTKKNSRGLNENYARELMELHTLGVDGGYTQKDVIEVARCFTGWTIQQPNLGGSFSYNDIVHDQGEKVVLGITIPPHGGKNDAERVLDILARHPSTARFISMKLAQKFVADDPPPSLIDRLTKTFLDTDGDIRAVMVKLLDSPEFFSEGAWRAKVKMPLEMTVSAVRATGAEVDYAMPLANQIAQLGEPLYRKLEPTGYSSTNAAWVNSAALLGRLNFALALAGNRLAGVKLDTKFSDKPAEVARQVLFRDAAPQTLASIETNFAKVSTTPVPNSPTATGGGPPVTLAGLMLGSPDFQRK